MSRRNGVDGLVEAVRKGHPRHVQLLLEAGVSVDDHDHAGVTAMVAAVLTPQEDRLRERLIRLLLQAGANPNAGDSRGTTPLMHAAINNVVSAAVFFLQQENVDLSLQDGDGNSALMYAAAFGHREIVLLILAAFKKLHHVSVQGQRNGQGLTAWQLAQKNGHEDIATLLQVESQHFGAPAGPSCFIPTNPLDLDRPPTPTETPTVRPSSIRFRSTGRSKTVPCVPKDPTAPLQPPCPLDKFFPGEYSDKDSRGRRRKSYKERESSYSSSSSLGSNKLPPSYSIKAREDNEFSDTAEHLKTAGEPSHSQQCSLQKIDVTSNLTKNLISSTSVVLKIALPDSAEKSDKSKDIVTEGQNSSNNKENCSHENCSLTDIRSDVLLKRSVKRDKTSASPLRRRVCHSDVVDPLGKSKGEKVTEQNPSDTKPVLVTAPDAAERQVLEELMRDLALSGSPGSGNEADTESLMECEGSPRKTVVTEYKMSGPNNRKMTMSNVPLTVVALTSPNESMPKIDLSCSSRSLNRSIQHLVQEDTENRPGHRPPTPARPSLPTLLPGRIADKSLNASLASTKSEGRYAPPSRRITFSSFPRSSSEPRSLTSSPRPHQNPENDYDSDSDEHSSDLLDSSTRSEGWDHLRGSRGRGPPFTTASEGHVVTLPPINQAKYAESALRGREGSRGRGGVHPHGETVLSVAKKTLEQLETVLAPTEGPSFSRSIPRTRATHQIHMET